MLQSGTSPEDVPAPVSSVAQAEGIFVICRIYYLFQLFICFRTLRGSPYRQEYVGRRLAQFRARLLRFGHDLILGQMCVDYKSPPNPRVWVVENFE